MFVAQKQGAVRENAVKVLSLKRRSKWPKQEEKDTQQIRLTRTQYFLLLVDFIASH